MSHYFIERSNVEEVYKFVDKIMIVDRHYMVCLNSKKTSDLQGVYLRLVYLIVHARYAQRVGANGASLISRRTHLLWDGVYKIYENWSHRTSATYPSLPLIALASLHSPPRQESNALITHI